MDSPESKPHFGLGLLVIANQLQHLTLIEFTLARNQTQNLPWAAYFITKPHAPLI